jgi:hypothetical protein
MSLRAALHKAVVLGFNTAALLPSSSQSSGNAPATGKHPAAFS